MPSEFAGIKLHIEQLTASLPLAQVKVVVHLSKELSLLAIAWLIFCVELRQPLT